MINPLEHKGSNHLFPVIDAEVYRDIQNKLIFGPFIGDVKYSLNNKSTGERIAEVEALPQSIVHRSAGFNNKNTDTVEVPLRMPYEGDPLYGYHFYPGQGEKPRVRWRKQYVNMIAKVISEKMGPLDELRRKDLERIYRLNQVELTDFFARVLNAQFISALYEAHSDNVTTGVDEAPDGIGASKVYHPNMYSFNGATAAAATMVAVGTEKKNKLASEITTAAEHANIQPLSVRALEEMGIALQNLKVEQVANYKGSKYWAVCVNRELMTVLRREDVFRTTVRDAFISKEYENPLFNTKAFIFADFMFIQDNDVTRGWHGTADGFHKNGWLSPAVKPTSNGNYVLNVLGNGALSVGNVIGYETRTEGHNFDLNSELLAMSLMGVSRGEFVEEANEANYFHTGNQTAAALGTAYDVKNQSSAQFIVKYA